jgi:hypothetical protein
LQNRYGAIVLTVTNMWRRAALQLAICRESEGRRASMSHECAAASFQRRASRPNHARLASGS